MTSFPNIFDVVFVVIAFALMAAEVALFAPIPTPLASKTTPHTIARRNIPALRALLRRIPGVDADHHASSPCRLLANQRPQHPRSGVEQRPVELTAERTQCLADIAQAELRVKAHEQLRKVGKDSPFTGAASELSKQQKRLAGIDSAIERQEAERFATAFDRHAATFVLERELVDKAAIFDAEFRVAEEAAAPAIARVRHEEQRDSSLGFEHRMLDLSAPPPTPEQRAEIHHFNALLQARKAAEYAVHNNTAALHELSRERQALVTEFPVLAHVPAPEASVKHAA
jgi:hypothetical protein